MGCLDDPAAPYIFTRSPVLDVGSSRALSLAQASIDECVHKHTRCIQLSPSSDPRLPTRLVDCTDLKRPRLLSTHGRHGKYLALSYVWGEAQPHRTTTSNVSAYSDIISPSVLPRTIRDAIYVAHVLGFRFLWIDSLCIIQDSDEDKLHELGRMHHVYRYAFLTLIAASARTVSKGFLRNRPASHRDIAFPFPCGPSALQVGKINLSVTTPLRSGPSYAQPRVEEPINARGWCLQEYYMSPRALIFASDTLRFRCQTATQNVGNAYYNQVRERRLPHVLFLRRPPPAVRGAEDWTAVHRAWWDIVEDYSRRVVSTPSDKLVACGAIADAFRRVLHSEYLAGLWRDTLLQDLLWEKEGDTRLERPAVFRAPSWSWAAVDGRVKMKAQHYLDGTALAEVVRCTVVLKDAALRFGQVTAGSFVLHAPLIQYDARSRPPSSLETSMNDEADAAGFRRAWLVPLWRPNTFWMSGLIVTRVDSDSPNMERREVYRRIGKFGADPLDDLYVYALDQLVEVGII